MSQLFNSCLSGTTELLYDTPYPLMRPSHKKLFAVAVISALGFLLFCIFNPYIPTGTYPLASQIISYTSLGLCAAAVITHLYLRVKMDPEYHERWAYLPDMIVPGQLAHEESFSVEQNMVMVTIDKPRIKEEPLEVLGQFIEVVRQHMLAHNRPRLQVALIGQAGYDMGGLSENFLDDLFGGLVEKGNCKSVEQTSLAVPKAKDEEQYQICYDMGQVLMWCFPIYVVGIHFDLSLFKIAFSFTNQELEESFEAIQDVRKLALYRLLLEAQEDKDHDELLRYLETADWDEGIFQGAAFRLFYAESLPEEWRLEDQPNYKVIKQDPDYEGRMRGHLFDMAKETFDEELRGIHAFASGMHAVTLQRNISRTYDHLAFSMQVQGIFTKEAVAEGLKYNGRSHEIRKKMGWIKNWILDPATEEQEVKQVLKFITGRTGIKTDEKIKIKAQSQEPYLPIPIAHTCTNEIELAPVRCGHPKGYNDFTEENFIACFKQSVLGDDNFSQV